MYACFIDLTKAFDLVNYNKLFEKLHEKINPLFLRLLGYIYTHQLYEVRWQSEQSFSFKVHNGVRQGAILSPTLFSIYIDSLFSVLEKCGYGCYVENIFSGIFGYADDLVLLSPDRTGLQQMLDITKSHLDDLGLQISVNVDKPTKSKTKTVAFGCTEDPAAVKLEGVALPWCDSYTHLGHLFHRSGFPSHDCEYKRRTFIGQYNTLVQVLHKKDPAVYMKLIQIYMYVSLLRE